MLLNHFCLECSFRGMVLAHGRKVQCPSCGTVNDFWLEGEEPPANHK